MTPPRYDPSGFDDAEERGRQAAQQDGRRYGMRSRSSRPQENDGGGGAAQGRAVASGSAAAPSQGGQSAMSNPVPAQAAPAAGPAPGIAGAGVSTTPAPRGRAGHRGTPRGAARGGASRASSSSGIASAPGAARGGTLRGFARGGPARGGPIRGGPARGVLGRARPPAARTSRAGTSRANVSQGRASRGQQSPGRALGVQTTSARGRGSQSQVQSSHQTASAQGQDSQSQVQSFPVQVQPSHQTASAQGQGPQVQAQSSHQTASAQGQGSQSQMQSSSQSHMVFAPPSPPAAGDTTVHRLGSPARVIDARAALDAHRASLPEQGTPVGYNIEPTNLAQEILDDVDADRERERMQRELSPPIFPDDELEEVDSGEPIGATFAVQDQPQQNDQSAMQMIVGLEVTEDNGGDRMEVDSAPTSTVQDQQSGQGATEMVVDPKEAEEVGGDPMEVDTAGDHPSNPNTANPDETEDEAEGGEKVARGERNQRSQEPADPNLTTVQHSQAPVQTERRPTGYHGLNLGMETAKLMNQANEEAFNRQTHGEESVDEDKTSYLCRASMDTTPEEMKSAGETALIQKEREEREKEQGDA